MPRMVLVTRLNGDRRIAWWGGKPPRQNSRIILMRFLGALCFTFGSMRISDSIDMDGYLVPAICVGLIVLVVTAPALVIQAVHNRAVAAQPTTHRA